MKNHGLKTEELDGPESAIRDIIRYYTREAGVRDLERELSKICRKVVKTPGARRATARRSRSRARNLDKFLGVRRYTYGIAEKKNQVGQVTGLAWTEVGGELLTIEVAVMPGKGKMITTGKLGEVMQESVQAALSVVRSRAQRLGIADDFYQKSDIHIHLPEGATPKDGPSAGIGICTAMVSALTGIPVRADVAMTGEITLRGEVLPIGGLKEKLLAAHRGGSQDRADSRGEREGPRRDSGQRQEPARDHPGEVDRPGARHGARAQARAARRRRGGRARRRPAGGPGRQARELP